VFTFPASTERVLGRAAGLLVAPVYQASFPELERLLLALGALIASFLVAFVLYVRVMASNGWPGTRSRTIFGILGGLLLLGLGVAIVLLALVLTAPPVFITSIFAVLACLGIAAWLFWRYLRRPRIAATDRP